MRTLFIVLVRVFILLAAFWLIRGLVRTLIKAWIRPSTALPPPERLERDPVCGTYIVAEGALKISRDNEQHFFCSTQCRDKYLHSRPA
jgi:YHS domain-containing protein